MFEVGPCMEALKRDDNWQFVFTGVGGVHTTYVMMKAIEKARPDIMIQAGIAGSMHKQMKLGTVAVAGSDCFGDLGVIEDKKRRSVFDLNLLQSNRRPYKDGKLVNPHRKLLKAASLPIVDAVTVNEVTTAKADIAYYKDELNTAIESMEGAAFHYVALLEKIPFVQMRGISNYAGERNKDNWRIKEAITNLNIEVLKFIQRMTIGNIKLPIRSGRVRTHSEEIKGAL